MRFQKMVDKNSKDLEIITRPNASPGFWLCFLLPLAYLSSIFRYPLSSQSFEYRFVTVTAWGLCLQSINFFLYVSFGGTRFLRILFAFIPGLVTATLYYVLLHQQISVCIFWGFTCTIIYQCAFIKTIKTIPKSFTYGEASIVVQGVVLFVLSATIQVPYFISKSLDNDFQQMNAIMMEGLLFVFLAAWIIYAIKLFQNVYLFYLLMIILIVTVCTIPVTQDFPLVTLLNFMFKDLKRLFVILFYLGLVGLTVTIIMWQVKKSKKATTSIRKIFHILVVFVYIPGLLFQCTFLYIASGVALAVLIILETSRLAEIYPFGDILKQSFEVFADSKDIGTVALTPFYLLVGCSLPLWLHPCTCDMTGDSVSPQHLLTLLSGILSVGVGDTAASIFGSNFGKHKLKNSEKSIEGTLASIIFQGILVASLHFLNLITMNLLQIGITSIAVILISLIEAYTDQIDNIVLPITFYIVINLA